MTTNVSALSGARQQGPPANISGAEPAASATGPHWVPTVPGPGSPAPTAPPEAPPLKLPETTHWVQQLRFHCNKRYGGEENLKTSVLAEFQELNTDPLSLLYKLGTLSMEKLSFGGCAGEPTSEKMNLTPDAHAVSGSLNISFSEPVSLLRLSAFLYDRESREHEDTITTEITEELQPAKVPLLPKDIVNSKKVLALRKEQRRKLGKQRSIGSPMDYSPLPIDKHEPEFGPCRRKLDGIIQGMKDTSRVMALSLYLPNCDRKGFFKRKQCKPSRGRKRGICWCVDKYGVQLPGTDYSGGDIQCKDLENSNNNNE
ncbi:hypothetical protein NQZ68_007177 [Dissostichus eleginoides]|nr:hypothetical protein NQZ68_007177 [Dissostichus eleginoides]